MLEKLSLLTESSSDQGLCDQQEFKKRQSLYGSASSVAINELLISKEERQAQQQSLLTKYQQTLVCLTLMAPGAIKKHQGLRFIFYKALREMFNLCEINDWYISYFERQIKNTGYEAYWVISVDAEDVKRALVTLEEDLSYGRLCDFDAIEYCTQNEVQDGFYGKIISRSAIGKAGRQCLVCDDSAHACTRSQKHSLDDVLSVIEKIILDAIKS